MREKRREKRKGKLDGACAAAARMTSSSLPSLSHCRPYIFSSQPSPVSPAYTFESAIRIPHVIPFLFVLYPCPHHHARCEAAVLIEENQPASARTGR